MVAEKADVPAMSLEQYRAMERAATGTKHEYVDGHVYLMAGGTRLHSILGRNVVALLTAAIGGGPREVYNSDMRVRLSKTVQVYPDATVTCDARDKVNDEDDEIAYPRLVVEVLSPGTERTDRGQKLRDYQACRSVEEYVLVNSEYQAAEVYRRSGSFWTYLRFEIGEDVVLASIDARFPLGDIYRRTAVATTPSR